MTPDLIVGVGSPHGDDAVGWQVVERLSGRVGTSTRVVSVSEPTQILFHLDGCRTMWIVDACRSGLPRGTVIRMVWPDPRIGNCAVGSTHAPGLDNILQLAQTLGRLPEEVLIYAVEVGTAVAPGATTSPEIASAVPEIEQELLQELSEFQEIGGSPPQGTREDGCTKPLW